ncbi:MFS transporter [Nonomuraea spiralis]|uniref:MFS transporter n=1 Tax=Nonomuraea spiralis TaxID=46182 RepID=A0ABV5IF89_9ACTN|nr:MFS transporter [Nonomuraea spiralis]
MAGVQQIRCFKELLTDYPAFRRSWVGSTISMLGSRTIGVTYPLLAYTLTESPTWIGWVMFASTVPGLLWYVPAGALIDRLGPRRVMVWSEYARGILVAGLCAAMAFDVLRLHHLVIVALLEGTLSINSSVAETALIPTTVKPGNVETALALHEGSVHGMVLAGRPLGGMLFGLGPIVPFLANTLMFFSAGRVLSRLERDITAKGPRGRLLADMRAGLVELWNHRFLRAATIVTALMNLMVQGLIVVFLSKATNDGLPSALAGVILAASGIGGIAGALLSPRWRHIWQRVVRRASRRRRAAVLIDRFGLARLDGSMMLAHTWMCAAALTLPLALNQAPPVFAVSLAAIGLTGGLSNVTIRTALSRVPSDLVARVVGVSRLGSYSAVALGPLLASLLIGRVEPFAALLLLSLTVLVLALVVTLVPVLRSSLIPQGEPESVPVTS